MWHRSEPCYQSLYLLPCFLRLVVGHWGEALFALSTLTFKRSKSIYISCVEAPQTIGGWFSHVGLLERVAMKKQTDNRCLSNFVQECLAQRLHGAVVEYIAP
ncbi:hypothetical protein C8J55DRAFT_531236 [Lentinula edodes]|uniref:Uncharacterized protein n=1 Tax=Lentinula lateritia TaxID=40482 RepID=A0A9W8ZPY7_9AGAR|nr:hypothetical protein C8J55DRAFT_531236 [Lentinula edodes]